MSKTVEWVSKMSQCLRVGDKIWFKGERLGYTVQAVNDRYAVCNKPFNPKRTVIYCIVDFQRGIRSPEDRLFGLGAETREQCEEMLERVTNGETGLSHRHKCLLDIVKVEKPS